VQLRWDHVKDVDLATPRARETDVPPLVRHALAFGHVVVAGAAGQELLESSLRTITFRWRRRNRSVNTSEMTNSASMNQRREPCPRGRYPTPTQVVQRADPVGEPTLLRPAAASAPLLRHREISVSMSTKKRM
jgi:hypothetical protein